MRPTNAAFVSLTRQSRRLVLLMKTLRAWHEASDKPARDVEIVEN